MAIQNRVRKRTEPDASSFHSHRQEKVEGEGVRPLFEEVPKYHTPRRLSRSRKLTNFGFLSLFSFYIYRLLFTITFQIQEYRKLSA